jgi:two-component system phosphate regulon response regulator PhoB
MNDVNTRDSIVIVEDDPTIRCILEMALKGAGYVHVQSAARGDDGLALVRRTRPSLLILDLMLPGLDGLEVCRAVRASQELADTRILMLTARSENADVVRGLELGADDYVTKPFDRAVLLARIRAVLRRGDAVAEGRPFDGLLLDEQAFSAKLNGRDISLTPAEFRMLALLVSRPGRVYPRARILDAMQTDAAKDAVTERTVDVLMVGLRKKLGPWAAHIETIRGVGYRVKG